MHIHKQNRKANILQDRFYEELDTAVIGIPKNEIKIPLRGINAKVGFEGKDRSVAGNCGLYAESNDNRLASVMNTVIGSTTLLHKNIHLVTWRSPHGTTENQIYHILIDAKHKNNMMHVRTYRDANSKH